MRIFFSEYVKLCYFLIAMNKLFEKNKLYIKRTNTLSDFTRKMKNRLN